MSDQKRFPKNAVCAYPVFYKQYSRLTDSIRESWSDVCDRTQAGLFNIGKFTPEQQKLIKKCQEEFKTLPSGRWLWVGGTSWLNKPENWPGAFNCTSTEVVDWESFALMADLAMQGSGTGAVLEDRNIRQLPIIKNKLNITILDDLGQAYLTGSRVEETYFTRDNDECLLKVGDSRQGWISAYKHILELASLENISNQEIYLVVSLKYVRPNGEKLKGFGGVANPVKLPEMFIKVANILNRATSRQLKPIECCLVIDEMMSCIVAGNIRRSASMKQFAADDLEAAVSKLNLWQEDENGNWRIDPERDALRMSNHTRVFHQKPTREECIESVRTQYECGEGAIQWAGEAVARANVDLLDKEILKTDFLNHYNRSLYAAKGYLEGVAIAKGIEITEEELNHRMIRYALNPCGEIISTNFFCNLAEIHLNTIDPTDFDGQEEAFTAGALSTCALLQRGFVVERYQKSRELDPITGVSITGLFDFFVKAFGVDWLHWWEAGRPQKWLELDCCVDDNCDRLPLFDQLISKGIIPDIYYENWADLYRESEKGYLSWWRSLVEYETEKYCKNHNLRKPNRCTTGQPAGTKSLLTGASSGWHPPKSQYFIRRITIPANDPIALACIDYGYTVIPSQSCKDENGNLLNDPNDPRVWEWLVEIPTAAIWAGMEGVDDIEISNFSALAQFDFYMQVQKYYVGHNTSGTLEIRSDEVELLGNRIYEAIRDDEGYISVALLARFDDSQSFPRMPFEPISKQKYLQVKKEVESRRISDDFDDLVTKHTPKDFIQLPGIIGCDSDKCLVNQDE